MPDLHGWITQQVDKAERRARHDPKCLGRPVQISPLPFFGECGCDGNVPALRRCEADRRILARHRLNPDVHFEPACLGCGTYGDRELSETDNLNECPELLDLAYAHGLTPEILAALDQPVPPPMPPRPEPRVTNLSALVRLMSAQPTSSVPTALRGPKWKARP
ncbi:hypothetical protein [Streptomyces sp. NBC_01614]|uniref:hypothetical protein n=1 Tax=Streptomyces sp. NBC_01614 TaxID=2975897 RepID=UPI00386B88BC